jgi:hypothetical protein
VTNIVKAFKKISNATMHKAEKLCRAAAMAGQTPQERGSVRHDRDNR